VDEDVDADVDADASEVPLLSNEVGYPNNEDDDEAEQRDSDSNELVI
jgi:hypothetical protein